MQTNGKIKSVSLYFHIPFCLHKKCPYCHFYTIPFDTTHEKTFLKALFQEWKMKAPLLKGKEVISIYFGGGTPSLLKLQYIGAILNWIQKECHLSPNLEITLETNPEDVTKQKFQTYSQLGINRISVGVQSLSDSILKILKRNHTSQEAIQALFLVVEAGISNVSIDLIYDLPKQTLLIWEKTIQKAANLPITHLSLYNLTIEPQTPFFNRKEELKRLMPEENVSLQMFEMAHAYLQKQGFNPYEISAFAKNELYSRHNTGYWTGRPFLGFGPSAFSYWDKSRFQNIPNLNQYSQQLLNGHSPCFFQETLSEEKQIKELFVIHLRLLSGVDLDLFQTKHGPLPQEMANRIENLKNTGLINQNKNLIKLSSQGIRLYDSIAQELI